MTRRYTWFAIVLPLVLLVDFAVTSLHFMSINRYTDVFQSLILHNAVAVREGAYHYDGNYSPLYFWCLSLVASRHYEFFTLAKIISLLLVLFSISISSGIAYRLGGKFTAALTSFWLLGNWTFLALSFDLRAEVLLLPLFIGAWYFSARGFDKPVLWIAGGGLAGAVYLTKGTGLLIPAAVALTSVFVFRNDWKRYGTLGFYLLSFVLAALPLLILNQRQFGFPFYNWSTSHAVWMQDWSESQRAAPTIATYMNGHGLLDAVHRQLHGIFSFAPVFFSIFFPQRLFLLHEILFWPFLAALAAGGVFLYVRRQPGIRRISIPAFWLFTAVLATTFFLIFAWYNQVSSSERFVLGFIPIGFIGLSLVTTKLFRNLSSLNLAPASLIDSSLRIGKVILLFVAAAGCAYKTWSWSPRNPFLSDRNDPLTSQLISLFPKLSLNAKLAVNTIDYVPVWMDTNAEKNTLEIPAIHNDEEWMEFMKEPSVRWVFIAGWDEIGHSEFYRSHFGLSEGGGLTLVKPFPGAKQVLVDVGPQAVLLQKVPS